MMLRIRAGVGLIVRPGEAFSFTPGRETASLVCISGRLHVTQTGDLEDHLLGAGDRIQFLSRGRVVVSCCRGPAAARLEVTGPRRRAASERLLGNAA